MYINLLFQLPFRLYKRSL